MKDDELISPREAAKMLGVSVMAIRSWENDKKIKCVRTLGGHRRYRLGDIQKILEKNSG
jgi:excisionase family DNA binding protein